MKANEFRLGNYVKNLEGEISKITGISDPIVATELINGDLDAWCDPIPLTEEWLLKFGWEWDIFYQGYFGHNYTMFPNNNKGWRISYCKRKYDMIVENIEYVHQLQNLYFALTGEELIFNP